MIRQLRDVSRRNGVSIFMSFFAALVGAVRRRGTRDDLAIATLIANRLRRETEE